jgi:hypothetical protein
MEHKWCTEIRAQTNIFGKRDNCAAGIFAPLNPRYDPYSFVPHTVSHLPAHVLRTPYCKPSTSAHWCHKIAIVLDGHGVTLNVLLQSETERLMLNRVVDVYICLLKADNRPI